MEPFKVMTALITPFTKKGKIDYPALQKLIEQQLAQQVDGLIVCGTTAETPCLKEYEKFDILRFVLEVSKHKVPIWFGCGTNQTLETLRLVKKASYYDIDGVLLVTPYYNRPSQQGLYRHFKTIADAIDIPIMLYHVPSRCNVILQEDTLLRLFQQCPNICALKHASDDVVLVQNLKKKVPHIKIYSGEDKTFFEAMPYGLDGLISVVSNLRLSQIKDYVAHPEKNKKEHLQQLADCAFIEGSPASIKYMMHKEGLCENTLRLPLVAISHASRQMIDVYLKEEKRHHSQK